jgi:hypothetical protein
MIKLLLSLSFLLVYAPKSYSQSICFDYSFVRKGFVCDDLGIVALESSVVVGKPPLPISQLSEDTLLWVSRALVSEAGFEADREYASILWILARKWHKANAKDPSLTFKNFLFSYCTGFKPRFRNRPRQRWVQYLPEDGETKPVGWPRHASWNNYKNSWFSVRIFVKAWSEGSIPDSCSNRATDWAAPHIKTNPNLFYRVHCGNTKNKYYRVRK